MAISFAQNDTDIAGIRLWRTPRLPSAMTFGMGEGFTGSKRRVWLRIGIDQIAFHSHISSILFEILLILLSF